MTDARQVALAWQASLFPNSTLPELCMDIRMALNGSADPLPRGYCRPTRDMLQARVETWRDDVHGDWEKAFDSAVLNLVKVTISLLDARLEADPDD